MPFDLDASRAAYAPINAARNAIMAAAATGHVRESLWRALLIAEARHSLYYAEGSLARTVEAEARHYPEAAA